MCGIAGIFHFDKNRSVDMKSLKTMTDTIQHRGPDGRGFYMSKNIGMGHRRLSIIDLETGDQPMLDKVHNLVLVFNGEIYNFIELRSKLIKYGHIFETKSDTEVILKSYLQWGEECLNYFNGCWAFALWDSKNNKLFLARDRLGEKPLFYTTWNDSFLFSSEIKSFFKIGYPRTCRSELIELYLFLTNIPAPNTFFQNIYKLLPGHYIVIQGQKVMIRKYWDIPQLNENEFIKDNQLVYNEFRELITDSIKIQMRSDVPYGAFLSGGLDSSSVVSLMSQISQHPVETFTMGFSDKYFDESNIAEITADHFNTSFNLHYLEPIPFADTINTLTKIFDEPFGDSSAIPTGEISKFAAKKVKMVLTGDGGDEVLSGYNSYLGLKYISIINSMPTFLVLLCQNIAKWLSGFTNNKNRYLLNKVTNILETSHYSYEKRAIYKMPYAEHSIIKKLTKEIKARITIEEYIQDFYKSCLFKDDFYKMMYYNFKHSLPNDYLVKVDRMTMSNSLEARIPFIDFRLVELMTKVDKSVKLQNFEQKSVLRKTIGKGLPSQVLNTSKKGFGVPLREWFKEDNMIKDLNGINKHQSILDNQEIDKLIQTNKNGEKDYGNFIWTILMLFKAMQIN